jgi:uncharacterized protein with von Willebrand factor type A (vWA) domain
VSHAAESDVITVLASFARALREADVPADQGRVAACVSALALVDLANASEVYWVARITLCSGPGDFPHFDALFAVWFQGQLPALAGRPDTARAAALLAPGAGRSEPGPDEIAEGEVLAAAAADAEVLRHRDVAELSDAERAEVNRMIALLRPRMALRRAARYAPGGRGRISVGRTVRAMLRDGGEPGHLVREHRREKARRLVFLLDISGSMAPYAEVLVRFAHAAVRATPPTTEVFTVSTRLTRVTRQLRLRDPDLALRAAGTAVPDWSGGTRLGESLQAFLDRWGQRGTARGAIVIIASDGWERGEAVLLGEQMRRLSYLARRIVWINPHRGKEGYAPVTAGMIAALPSIDDLVAGHSFEALSSVAELIARA